MRFFLETSQSHSKAAKQFPKWFILAEDDTFLRVHMLNTILQHRNYQSEKEFMLVPISSTPSSLASNNGRNSLNLDNIQYEQLNCSNPCIHHIPVNIV